jgi:hypothetical protein
MGTCPRPRKMINLGPNETEQKHSDQKRIYDGISSSNEMSHGFGHVPISEIQLYSCCVK